MAAEKKTPPEVIRTTGLSSIYTCGYKAKNEPYQADPRNTYHGDLINIAANSQGDIKSFFKFYRENINADLGLETTLIMCMELARKYIGKLKGKYEQFYQEAKMYYPYNDGLWIDGTPDIHYYNHEQDMWVVEDLKTSTFSYYEGDDMWNFNMQTYVYPLMVMRRNNVDKCGFRYVILDKKKGAMKVEPREGYKIRTREECEAKLKEVIEQYYIPYTLFGETKARRQKLCYFCKFKDTTCPLRSVTTIMEG